METCIYKGIVTHRRFKPKRHFFSYKTFSIFFDLDELRDLQKKISIFSFNKFNIFSFYNKDHGDRDGGNLRDWVIKSLKENPDVLSSEYIIVLGDNYYPEKLKNYGIKILRY